MKKIILFGVFLLICSLCNANTEGRLEQLSEVLANGSNNLFDSNELPKLSIELKEKTIDIGNYDREWNIGGCQRDRFSGIKSCEIRNRNLTVMKRNGAILVFVLDSDYPGKNAAIKIDNNKTFYGKEGVFNETDKIISQMSKGNIAYTRAIKWPYLLPRDNEVELTGFKEAYSRMLKEYNAIP